MKNNIYGFKVQLAQYPLAKKKADTQKHRITFQYTLLRITKEIIPTIIFSEKLQKKKYISFIFCTYFHVHARKINAKPFSIFLVVWNLSLVSEIAVKSKCVFQTRMGNTKAKKANDVFYILSCEKKNKKMYSLSFSLWT